MSRGENAVRELAVRGPESRALELEVVPLNAWARLLLEQLGDPRTSGEVGPSAAGAGGEDGHAPPARDA